MGEKWESVLGRCRERCWDVEKCGERCGRIYGASVEIVGKCTGV